MVLIWTLGAASGVGCTSPERPISNEASWNLEVREVFGDEETVPLNHVYRLSAHPNGSLMIADGPPARVLLFRPDGKVVKVGGIGGGPGEYAYVDDVGFVGDTLWVTDARSSKAVFYDMEGRTLQTQRIALDPRSPFERETGPIRPLVDGAWMASVSEVSITAVLNDWVTTRPWYWVKGDSMTLVQDQPVPKTDFMGIEIGDGRVESLHPLPSGPIIRTAVDGRFHYIVDRRVATNPDSGVFSIHRLNPTGDTLWARHFVYDPIPVEKEWKDGWIRTWCQNVVEWLQVPEGQVEAAFRESVSMPEFFPPVSDFRTGTDGRLWIRETNPDTMEVQWLVLDSLGHELGRLHAPDGFRLLLPTGSDVYGVEKNELDVETVVRAGIVEAGQ